MTDSNLILYTNPMSRGRIARWMLEEVGEPYETVVLEYDTDMKSTEYLAINPMGKVPTVRHGNTVITECPAICAYLADAFPEAELAPEPGDRGAYYRWLFFAAGPIETLTTVTALGVSHETDRERMLGYGNYESVENALVTWLNKHEYITGERFTAADVYVSSHLGWGMSMRTLKENEVFVDYVDRTQSRPAHERATKIDMSLGATQ